MSSTSGWAGLSQEREAHEEGSQPFSPLREEEPKVSLAPEPSTGENVDMGFRHQPPRRVVNVSTSDLPITGSPKVRVRRVPERPLPEVPSPTTGSRQEESPRSPVVERTAQQTPQSPGPESWRSGGGHPTASEDFDTARSSTRSSRQSENVSKGMDNLLRSIHPTPPTFGASLESRQNVTDEVVRPEGGQREAERSEDIERRSRRVGEEGTSAPLMGRHENDRRKAMEARELEPTVDEEREEEGHSSTASERTEEEELKDEIEQSMRNDKEKIREQMESVRRIRVMDPKRASLGYASKRKSGIFSLHKRQDSLTKETETQLDINKLLTHLRNTTVETLANNQRRKVIAMSGGLNITQAYDFLERHGISSAPVYDEEGRTVGTIDSSDLMAFILISERPSLLQEVLRSNYEKDPFTKPVSSMIGASGRNQFTMVRATDTVYSLLQLFSLGRPSACVLDNEDMISWVVSQSSLVAFILDYLDSTGISLGKAQAAELSVIVSKIPFVNHDTKAGEAFVSLCIHQAQAAAVLDEKRHLLAEISSQCFKGMTKLNNADFYLPLEQFLYQSTKRASTTGWSEPVTCRASITLRELLGLLSSRKAHRAWVVEGRRNKVVGMITLSSIIRSILGVGCLYDQKPPVQGGKGADTTYFDITDPENWPHLRNK